MYYLALLAICLLMSRRETRLTWCKHMEHINCRHPQECKEARKSSVTVWLIFVDEYQDDGKLNWQCSEKITCSIKSKFRQLHIFEETSRTYVTLLNEHANQINKNFRSNGHYINYVFQDLMDGYDDDEARSWTDGHPEYNLIKHLSSTEMMIQVRGEPVIQYTPRGSQPVDIWWFRGWHFRSSLKKSKLCPKLKR